MMTHSVQLGIGQGCWTTMESVPKGSRESHEVVRCDEESTPLMGPWHCVIGVELKVVI